MQRSTPSPGATEPTYNELSHAFWHELSPEERIAAMRRGELTLKALAEWSRQAPHEVPRVNGEWEWIAASTPEVAEQVQARSTCQR